MKISSFDQIARKNAFWAIFYSSLLCLLLFSCTSNRNSGQSVVNGMSGILGKYYGDGKLWKPGDVKDVDITLTNVNSNTVKASIIAVLPEALQAMGGKKNMTGNLTVSPDYQLAGKVKLMIFNFDAKGIVDPKMHTILLNISGTVMGHPLNFELTGGPDDPGTSTPDYAANLEGVYYGVGTMDGEQSGEVTDVEMNFAPVDNNTVAILVEAVFPTTLQQAAGRQLIRGKLTVSPDYKLTGTVRLMRTYDLAAIGSFDPEKRLITLDMSGEIGGKITFHIIGNGDDKIKQ